MAELSSCDRDHTACLVQNIHYMTFYRKKKNFAANPWARGLFNVPVMHSTFLVVSIFSLLYLTTAVPNYLVLL